jgi:hypothetical protein
MPGCACILELLAEPLYILSQTLVLLELRLMVETVATFSRCLTMYFLIVKLTGMVRAFYILAFTFLLIKQTWSMLLLLFLSHTNYRLIYWTNFYFPVTAAFANYFSFSLCLQTFVLIY